MGNFEMLRRLARLRALDAETAERLITEQDGGPGSGNFGHAGRPGKVGGSSESGGGSAGPSSSGGSAPQAPASFGHVGRPGAKGGSINSSRTVSPQRGQASLSTKERAVAHFDLTKNLKDTADWCRKEKNRYDKDSIEYKAYENLENEFMTHSSGRPSESESREMAKERLSNISKQLKPYAVERYKRDMQNEYQITQDVCDIADALGVQMHGLQYRTKVASDNSKGICRIEQKIQQDLAEADAKANARGEKSTLTYEKCVDGLNDLVRYTQLGTEKNLVSNYKKTVKALEDKGYKVVKVKNFYNKDPMENPYRGLTCVFESPTGTKFEFQFHTPRSLAAKNAMHPIYEVDRGYDPNNPADSKITEAEHLKLQARMRNVSSREKVPYPVGIEKIQDYPPKK